MRTPDLSDPLCKLLASKRDRDKKDSDPRPGDAWKVAGALVLSLPALYVLIDELHHQEWDSPRLVGVALPYLLGALSLGLVLLAVGFHRAR